MCVQSFDDSLNSAIRITYRISLRSSSLREPRHPLLKVVFVHCFNGTTRAVRPPVEQGFQLFVIGMGFKIGRRLATATLPVQDRYSTRFLILDRCGNDPSAGSPTETLLRLHLPLNDEV